MKKFIKHITAFFFSVIIIIGCNSPIDIDTPRERIIIDGPGQRFSATFSEAIININDIEHQFNISKSTFLIDTTLNFPIYWMNVEMAITPNTQSTYPIKMNNLSIKLDSLFYNQPYYKIEGNHLSPYCSKYFLSRGVNIITDTLIYSDKMNNSAEIIFTLDKPKKEILANLLSKLFTDRVWLDYKDTIYNDTIIKVRYDTLWNSPTTWDDIIERRDTTFKQTPGKIEIEMRARDSIKINAYFRYRF